MVTVTEVTVFSGGGTRDFEYLQIVSNNNNNIYIYYYYLLLKREKETDS